VQAFLAKHIVDGMNKLSLAKRVQVISAFMECVGVNAASRMTDVSKPTILKLVVDLGTGVRRISRQARPQRESETRPM